MGDCYRSGDNGKGKGGGMDKKLADLAKVQQKEMREDQDDANKRGGRSPVRCSGNLDGGSCGGAMMAGIQNLFFVKNNI